MLLPVLAIVFSLSGLSALERYFQFIRLGVTPLAARTLPPAPEARALYDGLPILVARDLSLVAASAHLQAGSGPGEAVPALPVDLLVDGGRLAVGEAGRIEPPAELLADSEPERVAARAAPVVVARITGVGEELLEPLTVRGFTVAASSLAAGYDEAFLALRSVQVGDGPKRHAAACFAGQNESVDPDLGRVMLRRASPVNTQIGHAVGDEAFGIALAKAALEQSRRFVIYNEAYFSIPYPGGDIPLLYGVCTDVVIRAYRALGIDLQQKVVEARLAAGGRSISHRRTTVLKRFFARYGESLPVTDFSEDYRPGDIVTFDRPQNTGSRFHIAIVSDQIGASGDYMIIHNRGWGVQLEDALFVDRITGHYRYRVTPPPIVRHQGGVKNGTAFRSVPLPERKMQRPLRVGDARRTPAGRRDTNRVQ